MHRIDVQPLTREAFGPFGDVITTDGADHFPINDGTAERFHDLAEIQCLGEGAWPVVSIIRSQPCGLPADAQFLERHPFGSQAFIPLSGRPYIVIVAPASDSIDVAAIRAFRADENQGVNYHAGVWHHPLIVLDRASDFLVIDRAGPGDNCDTRTLPEPVHVGTSS